LQEGEDFASVILPIAHRAAILLREIFLGRSSPCGRRYPLFDASLPTRRGCGRIGRQKEQAQFAAQRLPESAGFLRAMRRATIDDHEDFALGTPDQAPRECDENSGVDVSVCQSSMIVGTGCARTNARTWSSCAASVCHLWPLHFRGRQSPVLLNCRMSLIAQFALSQSCAPPRGGLPNRDMPVLGL
jgi:hypothetical protein